VDFTFGRAPYTTGHGFLLWDGTGEGGSRGGFWSNPRKAWKYAAIGRFKTKNHTLEGFYLDRDDAPESVTGTRLAGMNYEYAAGENSTLGVTYVKAFSRRSALIDRDGMNVFNARAYTAPIPELSDLSFEADYAYEKNSNFMNSTAWTALGAYQFSKVGWKPKFSYRYAFFQGNDPKTPKNESFDRYLRVSTTGAHGGRVRSPASTFWRTPTTSRTRRVFTCHPPRSWGGVSWATGSVFLGRPRLGPTPHLQMSLSNSTPTLTGRSTRISL
jgi:hypothetical protein